MRGKNRIFLFLFGFLFVGVSSGLIFKALKPKNFNLLLIIVDTLRADHLSYSGYSDATTPHIDRLAREGCVFEEVYCQVPLTTPSHASILTGTNPTYHGVKDNNFYCLPSIPTLAEILAGEGYRTAAVVSCAPLTRDKEFDRGFYQYDDFLEENKDKSGHLSLYPSERRGEESIKVATSILESLTAGDAPFFLWVHLYDPHAEYSPPQPFPKTYDGEIAYVDQCIGILLRKLKESGKAQDTLIVFTSDHGEGLNEHGEKTHGYFLYNSTLKVPLIFHAPSLFQPKKVPLLTRSIDIFPTILGLLGVSYFGKSQGKDLSRTILGEREGKETDILSYSETYYPNHSFGWRVNKALIMKGYKYIDTKEGELYNIAEDPSEKVNLIKSPSHDFKTVGSEMKQKLHQYSTQSGYSEVNIKETLKGGKYWAFAPPLPSEKTEDEGPDPIEQVDIIQTLVEAQSLAYNGKRDEAILLLEKIVDKDHGNIAALMLLGKLYTEKESLDSAFLTFQRALTLRPQSLQARDAMLDILFRKGDYQKAQELIDKAIKDNEENAIIYSRLAFLNIQNKLYKEAEKAANKALNIDPKLPSSWLYLGFALWKQNRYKEAYQALLSYPSDLSTSEFKKEADLLLRGEGGMVDEILYVKAPAIDDPQEQIELYRIVLQIEPDNQEALFGLATCYRKLSYWRELCFTVGKLLRINPNHPQGELLKCWLDESERKIERNR